MPKEEELRKCFTAVPKSDEVIDVSEKTGNKRAAALAATAATRLWTAGICPLLPLSPLLMNAAACKKKMKHVLLVNTEQTSP